MVARDLTSLNVQHLATYSRLLIQLCPHPIAISISKATRMLKETSGNILKRLIAWPSYIMQSCLTYVRMRMHYVLKNMQ